MKLDKFLAGGLGGSLLDGITSNPEVMAGLAGGNLLKAGKGQSAAILAAIRKHFLGGLLGDEEQESPEMESPEVEGAEIEEEGADNDRLPKDARKRLAILVLGKKMK